MQADEFLASFVARPTIVDALSSHGSFGKKPKRRDETYGGPVMRELARMQTRVQAPSTGGTVSVTVRMPSELASFLKSQAAESRRGLTGIVIRWLQGVRSHFGLPEAATTLLESDRTALRMERLEYLLHVLFQRSLELRDKGPGFDAPQAPELSRQ